MVRDYNIKILLINDGYIFFWKNYTSNYSLLELLRNGNRFRYDENQNYGIFNIELIVDKNLGNVITGELVKYQDYKKEPVVKENSLSIEYIQDVILGKCRFFLLEKEHLIAYNPYGSIINANAFCKAFSGILIGADDTFNVESRIFPVNMTYDFINYLEKMQSITKLSISLTPSNPNNRDVWEEIDDKLRNMNVRAYKEVFEAKPGKSLDLQDEERSKIHMAEDGYGKAISEGLDEDGNDITISTDSTETILRKKVDKTDDVKVQLQSLANVFKSVINRFK